MTFEHAYRAVEEEIRQAGVKVLPPTEQATQIIMLSAGEVEREAWRAGVDAFLRKPEDIGRLTEMVRRLLARKMGGAEG